MNRYQRDISQLPTFGLYSVVMDSDGRGRFVVGAWLTTEDRARRYWAKGFHVGDARMGATGRTLAERADR